MILPEIYRIKILILWIVGCGLTGQQIPTSSPVQLSPEIAESPANPHLEKVLQEYGRLIEKYPENRELLYNLGNLQLFTGDPENALKNYGESLQSQDAQTQADALYNMGNAYHQLGELEKSVELYKDALRLNPHDGDIRHNYELSKRMLEMQPQQQQQNEQQEGEDQQNNQDQSQQKESQQQEKEKDGEKEDSQSESESGENSEKEEEQKQSNPEEGEEDQREINDSQQEKSEEEENDQSLSQQQSIEDQEKQLGKEEAEAILNAMKADEKNLKQKKYRSAGRVKLERDW